jgi:hypothetical protein
MNSFQRTRPSLPQLIIRKTSIRSRHTTTITRFLIKPRTVFLVLKYAIPTTFLLLFLGLYLYEPHVEIAFYDRSWVHKEIDPIAPLAGCFDQTRVSPRYNISEFVYGAKRNEVQAGIPLRMGLDCYDFAGTISQEFRTGRKGQSMSAEDRTQFHTYWRVDLAPFGLRQESMLKSFFATQDVSSSRLTLWSNGDLNSNMVLQTYLKRFPDSFALNVVDISSLAKGTVLEGSDLLVKKDAKAWVDGDLIRLLLLWNYGGVWVDMDSLLTRDLEPLLEHEFVTQWDCHGMIFALGQPPTSKLTNSFHRQNLSSSKWSSDAVSTAFPLFVRSIPCDGHLYASSFWLYGLGCTPVLQTLASPDSGIHSAISNTSILF